MAPTSPALPRAPRAGRAAATRRRMPLVLLIAVCVVATTAAVSGPRASSAGLSFTPVGHWVANPGRDTVFHVNGGAAEPDVEVRIPEVRPGSRMVQNADSTFVIDDEWFRRIDRASLVVTQRSPTPTADEPAYPVEAVGGPYSIYRGMGRVVRLGADPRTIDTGGRISDPVVTADGTLWMIRTDTAELCRLGADATVVSCPFPSPPGHDGALTVIGGRVAFLDITVGTLAPVGERGLGRPRLVGVHLPPDARVAATDVGGRIAVVDPHRNLMHLIDGADLDVDVSGHPAIPVALPPGDYAQPVASRSAVVLLEPHRHEVRTYDAAGRPVQTRRLTREGGQPRISRGEDGRVYVDGGEGRHVQVVDDRGRIGAVALVDGDPAAAPGTTPPDRRAPAAPARPGPGDRPGSPSGSTPPPGGPTPSRSPGARPAQAPPPGSATPADLPAGNPAPGARPPATQPSPGSRPPADQPPAGGTPGTDPAPPPGPGTTPSRPGVPDSPVAGPPPNLTVVITGGDVLVSWDAPADGDRVTAYQVGWTSPSGGGTLTRPGSTRTATLGGLTAGTAYRITVAAQTPAGIGAPATVDLVMRTVAVSRGETTEWKENCLPPRCAYIRTELRGFAPNTAYHLVPWSSKWGRFNDGATLTTNGDGVLIAQHRFPYSGVGEYVWVIVTGVEPAPADAVESNRLLWPEP